MDLSPPYNWCDARCDRCPLAPACPLQLRTAGYRWRHEARGEDPDDPHVFMTDFKDELEHAVAMVETIARESGVDLAAPPEQRPTLIVVQRIRDAGSRYARAALAVTCGVDDEDADTLRSCALLTAIKLGRLAGQADPSEAVEGDSGPNRLLLELLDERIGLALARLAPRLPQAVLAPFASVRHEVAPLLDSAFGPVAEEIREALRQMKAAGRAPSPFCTVPSAGDSSPDGCGTSSS